MSHPEHIRMFNITIRRFVFWTSFNANDFTLQAVFPKKCIQEIWAERSLARFSTLILSSIDHCNWFPYYDLLLSPFCNDASDLALSSIVSLLRYNEC